MVMVAMVHASVCFGEGGERCGDERNLKHRSKTRQRTEEEVEHYRAKDADWTDAVSSCLCPILGDRLERLARRCHAMICSLVIGTKTVNVFHEILGYGLIYRNFSVLLFS